MYYLVTINDYSHQYLSCENSTKVFDIHDQLHLLKEMYSTGYLQKLFEKKRPNES